MDTRITTDEVSIQLAKAVKLLLDWIKQEFVKGSSSTTDKVKTPLSIIESDQLLTAPEVAKLLHISKGMAYTLMQREEIPTVRMGQRVVRVRRKDLDEYINKEKPKSSPY